MTDRGGPASPKAPDLATLLMTALGEHNASWLAKHALDPDGKPVVTRQNADLLLKPGRAGWVSDRTMRALAQLLGLQDAAVYTANAVSLGLNPPHQGTFALLLPGWVDQLPIEEQMVLRNLVMILGRAHGLTD